MMNVITILNLIQIILLILTMLLAIIYLIPIFLIHRFQNVNNVFTVNFCFASIFCCIYWLCFYIILEFYPQYYSNNQICIVFKYFEMMCTFQVPLAIVEASVHRLFSIVYHRKMFFRKKQWVIICISIQWTIGMIFSLPRISINDPTCGTQNWRKVYTLIMIVIIPLTICFINNIIIFTYVRASTNRVQPFDIGTKNNQNQTINRRDLYLLRHMIITLCIFAGGWSPIYIYSIIVAAVSFTSMTVSLLFLSAELFFLCDIINLFLYNHELRRYLQDKIFKRR